VAGVLRDKGAGKAVLTVFLLFLARPEFAGRSLRAWLSKKSKDRPISEGLDFMACQVIYLTQSPPLRLTTNFIIVQNKKRVKNYDLDNLKCYRNNLR